MASMRLALRLKSLSDEPSSTSVTSELSKVLSLYNSFGLNDARRKRGADYLHQHVSLPLFGITNSV